MIVENSVVCSRQNGNNDFDDNSIHECYEPLNKQECLALRYMQQVWIKHEFSPFQNGYAKVHVMSTDSPRPEMVRVFFQSQQRLIDFTNGNDMVFKLKHGRKLSKIISKDPKKYLLH